MREGPVSWMRPQVSSRGMCGTRPVTVHYTVLGVVESAGWAMLSAFEREHMESAHTFLLHAAHLRRRGEQRSN